MAFVIADIPTGLVTGQYLFVSEDAVDADTSPDAQIVYGAVNFTASAKSLRMVSKKGTAVPLKFKAKFDSLGNLTPFKTTGIGLNMPATDSPLINPLNFTWHVEFDLRDSTTGECIELKGFDFQVPAGTTVDLTTVTPVDTSPGVLTIKGDPGEAATINVGTTTTSAAGTNASVTVIGEPTNPTLNFTIPRGPKGDTGDGGVPTGGTALQYLRKNAGNTALEFAALTVQTAAATPSTLALRDASGNLTAVQMVATATAPTQPSHTTRKDYVDTEVGTRVPRAESVTVGGNTYEAAYSEWSGPNSASGGGAGGLAIGKDAAPNVAKYTEAAASQSYLAIGRGALGAATRARACIAIGPAALGYGNPGFGNLAIGTYALSNVQGVSEWAADNAGSRNIGIGSLAGHFLTSGARNTFIGRDAGHSVTTGGENVSLGYRALATGFSPIGLSGAIENQYPVTASNNTAIGNSALTSVSASGNTALGMRAGANIAKGTNNTFIGLGAAAGVGEFISENNKIVDKTVKLGTYVQSGTTITVTSTGSGAVAGNKIGIVFTSGALNAVTGEMQWLTVATVTNANVFTLTNPASVTTSGNVEIRQIETDEAQTPGSSNVVIGAGAAELAAFMGGNSTYVGEQTGRQATGLQNSFFGSRSGFNLTTGSNNTFFGYNAGRAKIGGGGLTVENNITCIGNGSGASDSNQVQLGDASTTTYVYGTVQNRSDARDKADVRDTVLGLDFINKLRPVDYKWDMRDDYFEVDIEGNQTPIDKDGSKKRSRYHHGVIAQELPADFGGVQDHSLNGGSDLFSVGYDEFIAPLIKAVQELSAEVAELKGVAA